MVQKDITNICKYPDPFAFVSEYEIVLYFDVISGVSLLNVIFCLRIL